MQVNWDDLNREELIIKLRHAYEIIEEKNNQATSKFSEKKKERIKKSLCGS